MSDRVGPVVPVQYLVRQGLTMHRAVEPIQGVVRARPNAAVQRRQGGIALTVKQPCRRQTHAKRCGVCAGDPERDDTADDDSGTDRAAMREQERGTEDPGSASTTSAGRAMCAAMTASYCGLAGFAKMCSTSKASAPMPRNPARSGTATRSSILKSASGGSAIRVAPVAVTRSAKAAPVMTARHRRARRNPSRRLAAA